MVCKQIMDYESTRGVVKEKGKKVFLSSFLKRGAQAFRTQRQQIRTAMQRREQEASITTDNDRIANARRRKQARMDYELFGAGAGDSANRPRAPVVPGSSAAAPPLRPTHQTTVVDGVALERAIRNKKTNAPQKSGREPSSPGGGGSEASSSSSGGSCAADLIPRNLRTTNRGFWPREVREKVELAEQAERERERMDWRERARRERTERRKVEVAWKVREEARKKREEEERERKRRAEERKKKVVCEKRKRVVEEEDDDEDEEPVVVPKRKLRRVAHGLKKKA